MRHRNRFGYITAAAALAVLTGNQVHAKILSKDEIKQIIIQASGYNKYKQRRVARKIKGIEAPDTPQITMPKIVKMSKSEEKAFSNNQTLVRMPSGWRPGKLLVKDIDSQSTTTSRARKQPVTVIKPLPIYKQKRLPTLSRKFMIIQD